MRTTVHADGMRGSSVARSAVVAMLGLAVAACSAGATTTSAPATAGAAPTPEAATAEPSAAAGKTELVFLPHITPNLSLDFWQSAVDRCTTVNPDLAVTMVTAPDTATEKYAQQLLAAGDPPDVASTVIFNSGLWPELLPFDKNDPEIQQIQGLENALIGGNLLNLGIVKEARSTLFYNKQMFEKAGITTLPTTYAEFEDVLAKLKASGVTPMLTAGEWVTGEVLNDFSDTLKTNAAWYTDRHAGKVKFADQDWVDGATRIRDWAAKGYFNEGALGIGYAQLEEEFLSGNAAIYPMGTWFTAAAKARPPAFDIGVMAPPSSDGRQVLTGASAYGGYSVFKATEHPAEAVRLAKCMAFDREVLTSFLDADGQFSSVELASGPLDRELTPLQQDVVKLFDSVAAFNPSYFGQGDNSPKPGIQDLFVQAAAAMILGTGEPKAELEKIDAAWEAN
jgi:ABC-type glycerol-3-phosphate transport system substrate-binding protein